jgi:hypothetical protein
MNLDSGSQIDLEHLTENEGNTLAAVLGTKPLPGSRYTTAALIAY